jgi:hypothetical protein
LSDSTLDLHKIENYLLRLGAIAECIEMNGDNFITDEVRKDVNIALDFIKTEFGKTGLGNTHEQ